MASKHSKDEGTNEALKKQVSDFKIHLAAAAQSIVNDKLPAKILVLNDIFKNSRAFNLDVQKVVQPVEIDQPKNKKRKSETAETDALDAVAPVPSNKVIMEMLTIIKKEAIELVEMLNTVKIWIQLNIPRIEDGNNFGVGIQEETVNELSRAEESSFAILEGITKYFVNRAKLVSKAHKHSFIDDYRQSILELDEKEFLNMRLCCLDLRNNYAIIYDMIQKNLEKIKTPRASNHLSQMI